MSSYSHPPTAITDVAGFSIAAAVNNVLAFGGQSLPVPVVLTSNHVRIAVNITANTLANPVTFTLEKNGVSTSVVITVGAGVTGVFRTSGTVKFNPASDDRFGVRALSASPGGAITGNCVIRLH